MKQPILFLCFLLFCSCSEIIDNVIENAIPEPDTLEIGIKNSTNYVFNRVEITTKSGFIHVFQVTDPGYYSNFQVSDYAYDEVQIVIFTDVKNYAFTPIYFSEDTKVSKGIYYYDISIQNTNLLITRNKL